MMQWVVLLALCVESWYYSKTQGQSHSSSCSTQCFLWTEGSIFSARSWPSRQLSRNTTAYYSNLVTCIWIRKHLWSLKQNNSKDMWYNNLMKCAFTSGSLTASPELVIWIINYNKSLVTFSFISQWIAVFFKNCNILAAFT